MSNCSFVLSAVFGSFGKYDNKELINVQDIAQDWFESVDRERIPGKGFIGLNVNIASQPATLLDLCFVADGAGQLGLVFGEFELRRFVRLSCDLTDQQDLGVEKTGG